MKAPVKRSSVPPRKPLLTPEAVNRRQRRERQRRQQSRKAIAITALAFTAGLVFGGFPQHGTAESAAAKPSVLIESPAVTIQMPPQNTSAVFFKGLDSVSIDLRTQQDIMDICRNDPELFCAVMAIASTESGSKFDAIGDGGDSIGMMQINTYAQQTRMDELGITDLTDPLQNVTVAVDYIDWITKKMGSGESPYNNHALYMAYNMGYKGSKDAMNSGIYSTEYSRQTVDTYNQYLLEIGGGQA